MVSASAPVVSAADLRVWRVGTAVNNVRNDRADLLEILDDRVNSGSTAIASQLPVDTWHAYLGEPTLADAILDRLVHHSHRIELKVPGESMRKVVRTAADA